jgi:hypothetical protein
MAYVGFESGDVDAAINSIDDGIEFRVHPETTASFLGQGTGRALFAERLRNFLSNYHVLNFEVVSRSMQGAKIVCRVRFHYKHKTTAMELEGSMRHEWVVENGKVVRLDLMTDANMMSAYFKLSSQL